MTTLTILAAYLFNDLYQYELLVGATLYQPNTRSGDDPLPISYSYLLVDLTTSTAHAKLANCLQASVDFRNG